MVAFVTTRDTDGECYCDFLDGTTPETCNPPFPQLCRFVLHSPNQYSAAKRLQKWKERVGDDEGELEKLQLAAAAEDEVNKTEFQMCSGNPAIFGNIYQLLNPAADQFLQVERSISEEVSVCHLGCILLKMAAISLLTGLCRAQVLPAGEEREDEEPVVPADAWLSRSK